MTQNQQRSIVCFDSFAARLRGGPDLPWLRAVSGGTELSGRVRVHPSEVPAIEFAGEPPVAWADLDVLASTRELFGPEAGLYRGRILWRCTEGWRAITLEPGDPERLAVALARSIAEALPWRPWQPVPSAGRLSAVFGAVSTRYRLGGLAA